jgi:hypothetical protein
VYEYNVFLLDEPLKGSKSLKIFKISLTFRLDKLWHLSKSVHIRKKFSNFDSVEQKIKKQNLNKFASDAESIKRSK